MSTREVPDSEILTTADHTVPRFPGRSLVQKNAAARYRYSTNGLHVCVLRIGIAAERGDLTDEKICYHAVPGLRRAVALCFASATGLSPNTIRNYRTTFAKLKAYFESHPERSCIPSTSSGQALSGGPQAAVEGAAETSASSVEPSKDPAFDSITRGQLIDFLAWLRDEYLSEPDGAVPRGQIKLLPKSILNQLPSVGAGNVLRDVIAAIEGTGIRGQPDACRLSPDACAVIRLDTIFCQAAGSYIVDNAHRVVRAQLPVTDDPEATDFFLARTDDPARAAELTPAPTCGVCRCGVEQLVCERIPARFGFGLDEIQVLSPMHRGEAGVAALNARLQNALNPQWGGLGELEVGGRILREGDRVMQTVNDYARDVFNGDVGRVLAVNTAEKRLSVDFDGNVVSYEAFELDELALAYALTIHKSQGSEFPAVVVPVLNSHHIMLQRNLLYTAITRARKLVVLVGDPQAIAVAVRNDKVRRRYTALAGRLGRSTWP